VKVYTCEQRSEEWFAARSGIATASSFAAILATIKSGEAAERRNYRAKLVVERLTGRCIETFSTPAMKQGVEREPLAREAYEIATGNVVTEIGFVRHDTIEAGCSPDGLLDATGCLEIKAPELAAHLEYIRTPGVPAKYIPQVQGQLWLAEREFCDFVSYNPDFPAHLQLIVRRVPRDDKYIACLALAVEVFMGEVRDEEAAVRAIPVAA
jgi:putative phage-type endonuclease